MRQLSSWNASFVRQCARVLGAGEARNSLLMFMFHRVLPESDPLRPEDPNLKEFTAQMDVIRAMCSVLPLAEAVDRLFARSLPRCAACITFDDGYLNNLNYAAPVLRARGLPATVFVACEFLNGESMWTDIIVESVRHAPQELDLSGIGLGKWSLNDSKARRNAIRNINGMLKYRGQEERLSMALRIAEISGVAPPRNLMLTADGVRELVQNGIDIGSHTVSHPILSRLDDRDARREIFDSKRTLEAITGCPVTSFAYPNGMPNKDYRREHVDLVRAAGFTCAASSAWGVCRPSSDRYQLPRMRPWETSLPGFAGRLLYTRRAPREEAV